MVWLTTRSDKTTVATFARVAWRSVGTMCERVAADVLGPDRLAGLVDIGIDEISWRKHHRCLTLVTDHDTSTVVWGAPGRDTATLERFFDDLPRRRRRTDRGGLDGPGTRLRQRGAPPRTRGGGLLRPVPRGQTRHRRPRQRPPPGLAVRPPLPRTSIAKKYKGVRWALLKNPDDLTDNEAATLAQLRRDGGALWRTYQLKEALRAVFAGDLGTGDVMDLLHRWCPRAQRSRIPDFVKAAATIRKHLDGIAAAVTQGLSNGRHEGLNNKIRTMTRSAYGFHSPKQPWP